MPNLRARADRRFEETLRSVGARDPRDFYRRQLRELKARAPDRYERAVAHYEEVLIPAVAGDADPLEQWLAYGLVLAELLRPGEALQIDPTGRARPYAPPVALDQLVLHLPTSAREPVLAVGIPPRLSRAQRATYDLLVRTTGE